MSTRSWWSWRIPAFAALAGAGLALGVDVPDRDPSSGAAAPGTTAPAPADPRSEGTRKMARLLADLAENAEPGANRFLNTARAELARRQLDAATDPASDVLLRQNLVEELLSAGRNDEALALTEPLIAPLSELRPFVHPDMERWAREARALAWMRIGEQSNCLLHHGTESCILPIEGSGIHRDQRGSREAMAEALLSLQLDPDNLRARWLLNVAAMTVGEWPDRVPERWRIDPAVFASDHDIGRFRDVAIDSGLLTRGLAGGVVTEDLDGDGDLDVMFSHMGIRSPLDLFRNEGDGSFTERAAEAGLEGLNGGLNLVHADYDNDGDADVLVLRGGWLRAGGRLPNSLLRNRGDGTFEDVTEAAGILTFHPTQTAAWADYDGDGWLDLFVGNESEAGDPRPSELWRNNRDGTFRDRSTDLPDADLGFVKGAAWGDYDNDGRPDLYVSAYLGRNRLLHNDGPRRGPGPRGEAWSFTEVGARAGVTEPGQSFAAWWFDYDNDGWEDIFVSGYSMGSLREIVAQYLGLPNSVENPRLYRNRHDGTFEDVTPAVRLDRVALPMGANFGDLDNDGWLDLYLATGEPGLATLIPNRMFRNAEGRVFQDVTTSGGFGHLQKGHGVAFADMDGDLDQDVVTEMGGAYETDTAFSLLFENPGHGHHGVAFRLEGRRSNRSAIGTRIRARVASGEGTRDIFLTVGTGGSFGSASLAQEMGLGDAAVIEELTVLWPASRLRQVFRDVAADRTYRLVEGGELEAVAVTQVRLGGTAR